MVDRREGLPTVDLSTVFFSFLVIFLSFSDFGKFFKRNFGERIFFDEKFWRPKKISSKKRRAEKNFKRKKIREQKKNSRNFFCIIKKIFIRKNKKEFKKNVEKKFAKKN